MVAYLRDVLVFILAGVVFFITLFAFIFASNSLNIDPGIFFAAAILILLLLPLAGVLPLRNPDHSGLSFLPAVSITSSIAVLVSYLILQFLNLPGV